MDAEGDNFASLTFVVIDSFGAVSEPASVQINIAPNNAPVATPVPTIQMEENSNSTVFLLIGNHPHPPHTNTHNFYFIYFQVLMQILLITHLWSF